ncbi:DNA-binding CsgD family transcriptional regulator [Streptomyces luteogriseus]|uniref:helix-turn-helix transcriptional regulator n=1 Tax=Streptomyces luteogriseus TaxID=68233 RepID=UPI00278A46DC|nr:helix-turn-helix transcriptional regulator [Streptomyces luteogriseus]MDQ0717224.1 DNA-binding CsgD family transcriptional regulator [Streptomyces luteogriseus]
MTTDASDAVEIRNALLRLRRGTGLPIAFGGLMEAGQRMRISELSGTATHALRSLVVTSGTGLGGKTVALSRPCVVTDYSASRQISHEYDAPVAVEGLRSVLAVPVVVRYRVRGVLYGALRTSLPLGGRMLDVAVEAARDLERALGVRDEARTLAAEAAAGAGAGVGPGWEQVREAHTALRALAPRIADPELRAELLGACALLTAESAGSPRVRLAPREVDVLACVAAGATNAVAAERLGVTPETVKGYLRSAMRKLRARTRGEAVVAARRAGWLP